MNFLAHLHLASLAQSSLLGNLVADFTKGNPYQYYPEAIADGIMLHRRIDKLTDSLPLVKQACTLFDTDHRRIAPIALDIVWDHFLAKEWANLVTTMTLTEFIDFARRQIEPNLADTPASFQQLNRYLWQENWLANYAQISFVAKVLQGMANRRPKLGHLASSITNIEQHYDALKATFYAFYPDMIAKAKMQSL